MVSRWSVPTVVRPLAAIAMLAILLMGLVAPVAQAHAVLERTTPADGSRLVRSPDQIAFSFDEAVQLPPDATTVLGDDGRRVGGAARLTDSGQTVIIPIDPLPRGAYTASYRVVSADGHIVTGAIRFGVGVDPGITAPQPPTITDRSLTVADAAAQGVVYLGLVLGVGVCLAVELVWRGVATSTVAGWLRVIGWMAILVGTLARMLFAGPLAVGSGWAGVVRLADPALAVAGVGGVASIVRFGLLVLAAPVVFGWARLRGRRVGRMAAGLLGLGIVVTVALVGHAAAGPDAPIAVVAACAHIVAMAFWLGGLIVLAGLVLRPGGPATACLDPVAARRWSVLAFGAVVLLVLSGEYQAWRQLQPLQSVVDTRYGVTLLIKVGLVAVALTVAMVNHRVLIRGLAEGRPRVPVRRMVVVESVVTLAVICAATVLVALPPARTTYGPPVTVSAPLAGGTARIRVDGTRTGVQTLLVTPDDPAGGITGSLAGDGVTVPVRFTRGPGTSWTGRAVVPTAGVWTLTLTIDLGRQGRFATDASYRVW